MSPTVLRVGRLRFYFFSREEPRMHVHVEGPGGEAKYWLEPEIELAENHGLGERERRCGRSGSTRMTSARPGRRTLAVEVTNVSRHGFWLLLGERELFVPFEEFPFFREVPIGKLLDVRMPHAGHLYWPQLDVDLAVESIEHPERYPLVSKSAPAVAEPAPKRRARS